MWEQIKKASYNYSIKKLNICSIPLSVGLKNDIYNFLMTPKYWVSFLYNVFLFYPELGATMQRPLPLP